MRERGTNFRAVVRALLALCVAGCGGSPPPSGTDAGPPDAPSAIDAGSDAGPPPCPAESWPAASADRESAVLAELNLRRSMSVTCGATSIGPSAPLATDPALTRSTRCHAYEMMLRMAPSRMGADGSTWEERAAREGYVGLPTVESIGYLGDTQTPAAIVDLVLADGSSCAGLLSGAATDVGIGMARDPAATGARTTYFEIVAGH